MDYLEKILRNLTPDLLKPEYRKANTKNKLAGHCYVASEAAYYLFARDSGYRPYFIRHEGQPHWYLDNGYLILDLTADQFKTKPDYSKGRRNGFLTKQASKRAQILMRRVLADKYDELFSTVPVWP